MNLFEIDVLPAHRSLMGSINGQELDNAPCRTGCVVNGRMARASSIYDAGYDRGSTFLAEISSG